MSHLVISRRWDTIDIFMQHDVQELSRVVSRLPCTDLATSVSVCRYLPYMHKPKNVHGRLVLGIKNLYMLFCFVDHTLFAMVGKELML